MAQRVALARALVNDPEILILDEPLGKLDSLTRITMQAELVALWQRKGFTTLLVTHDVEEALFLANRVIVFSDRPARIKADIAVDRPYPRHRGDPRLAELRRNILVCSDWMRHGERASAVQYARTPRKMQRRPLRVAQSCLLPNSPRGRHSMIATRVFRSRISISCPRPDCWR